jgi:DNA-binding HxlR family transcriptional regulator
VSKLLNQSFSNAGLDSEALLSRSEDPEIYQLQSAMERLMVLYGDKYSLQILDLLVTEGNLRFVALESKIPGISPRTLSQRLKHLERYGLIKRHQYPSIPPKVEYEPTEKALALRPIIESMRNWADTWFPYCPA